MNRTSPNVVFLIPAYNPGAVLARLVAELKAAGPCAVVVVNDGSNEATAPLFQQAAEAGAVVLRHAVNLGKGAALKTGLNEVLCSWPEALGVVTLDADGQHSVKDALAVASLLAQSPQSLIMGVRQFSRGVPFRSRLGNIVTRRIMHLVGGLKLTDTQSGLRGIPMAFLPELLTLRTTGYDYELDMLLATRPRGIRIVEQPIETIYLDGNASSHFNPFLDSLKIYMVFLRFNLSSILSVLIDYCVFMFTHSLFGNIALSQAAARACAGSVNYYVNRKFVFKSNKSHKSALSLYILGISTFGVISYAMIRMFQEYTGINLVAAKMVSELLLYIAGFFIQREIVFKAKND